MPRKRVINGYHVEITEGRYDPDDDSFGDLPSRSRPNARPAFGVSIANRFHHEKSLHPFDTEQDAINAAKKWTKEQNKHRVLR